MTQFPVRCSVVVILLLLPSPTYGQGVVEPEEVLRLYAKARSGIVLCTAEQQLWSDATRTLRELDRDTYARSVEEQKRCGRDQDCIRYWKAVYANERDRVIQALQAIGDLHQRTKCLEGRVDRSIVYEEDDSCKAGMQGERRIDPRLDPRSEVFRARLRISTWGRDRLRVRKQCGSSK